MKELDLTDFQMSRDWVHRFKNRHGIGLKVISRQAASALTKNNSGVARKGAARDLE